MKKALDNPGNARAGIRTRVTGLTGLHPKPLDYSGIYN